MSDSSVLSLVGSRTSLDDLQDKGREFLVKQGKTVPSSPTDHPVMADLRLYARILFDEFMEFVAGAGLIAKSKKTGEIILEKGVDFDINEGVVFDLVESVDGLADVVYVANNAASLMGVRLAPPLEEVCDNNLKKFGPGSSIDQYGKLIKPKDHKPPRLDEIVAALRLSSESPEKEKQCGS